MVLIDRQNLIAQTQAELLQEGSELFKTTRVEDGEEVLDVIVGDPGEKLFVGFHTHSQSHSEHAGSLPTITIPLDAPSRAYRKMEEYLEYTGTNLEPMQVALEIGSAPGGACYSLLRRGLRVFGNPKVNPKLLYPKTVTT